MCSNSLKLSKVRKTNEVPKSHFVLYESTKIAEGLLPSFRWKQAIVCPIFKKGSRKLPSNYRPVSLTSVCCKVMESIVYESMVFFLRSNSLISKDQFGFLARRSTCTQLLITLNEWTLHTDICSKIDSVYIDFAKAFDSISHRKLLYKVECYGFTPHLVRWLSSFLMNRFQQVYIDQFLSSSLHVTSGDQCLDPYYSSFISMTFRII